MSEETDVDTLGPGRYRGMFQVPLLATPYLAEFTALPSCALFRVWVSSIYLVTRFHSVFEFHFSP